MSTWRWLVVCGCTALLLSSCNDENSRSFKQISEEVKKNTVLVYYQDKKGHGTGFFIEGSQEGCNVLTARHVVPLKTQIKLKTSDQKIWVINDIQRFPNHDLAVINFKSNNSNKCPYKALSVGDSDAVDLSDDIYITGFTRNGSVAQFTSGKVSYVGESNTDGYGISYTAITAGGMSGGPVINASGEVIAVHGRTDVELLRIAELEGEELSTQEQSTASRSFKPGDSVGTFKWGIPIKAYSENVAKVRKISQQVLEAKDFYNQGNDLYASKDYEKAFEFYDKAVAIKPDYYQAWRNRGDALDELKRHQEAIESYDKAVAIKPDYHQAWYNRGYALGELKRYQEAIESYDKAIAIKPDYAYAWYNRGISLRKLERYQEAIESYDKAIAIKPDYSYAWYNRGYALDELKRYEEAIESYDKTIAIKPDYYKAWYNRGYALDELKRYEEAIESYDKAIAIKPNHADAWINRGISLRKLKRYQQAIESYDKAITIRPDYADAWNNRGYALEQLKRYKEAIESYDKAIKLNPNYQIAINNRKRLLNQF